MKYSKILQAKSTIRLNEQISNYINDGWKVINCFIAPELVLQYCALVIKE